ncbi:hypothetical protein NYZ99_18655 [Maribacter litopenaei]|uniref:Uncharacterized protein n=1 Tax=Maribacter litopenaei TaxID=2976127 RepID=A0ABY5Y6Y8_9FLAO|nr:hypothetical protein [Maribacter litopenaei]UWX54788.1 hypothetical protein NYZ99_18655 [Maribacter litopenaei]
MLERASDYTEEVYTKFRKLIVTKKIGAGEPICQKELSQILNANDDCLNFVIKKLRKEALVTLNSSKEIMVREVRDQRNYRYFGLSDCLGNESDKTIYPKSTPGKDR